MAKPSPPDNTPRNPSDKSPTRRARNNYPYRIPVRIETKDGFRGGWEPYGV